MIVRLVKMQFDPQKVEDFKTLFNKQKEAIRSFDGCLFLELLQEKQDGCVFFTRSFWNSEDDLNRYRNSDLFQSTWKETKEMFSGKPEAFTLNSLIQLP